MISTNQTDARKEVGRLEALDALECLLDFNQRRRSHLRATDCVPLLELLLCAAGVGRQAGETVSGSSLRWSVIYGAAETALRGLRTTELTVCAECGSSDLQVTGWIDANLGTEGAGDPGPSNYFCYGCGESDPKLSSLAWTDDAVVTALATRE